jgi:hypothetical protein
MNGYTYHVDNPQLRNTILGRLRRYITLEEMNPASRQSDAASGTATITGLIAIMLRLLVSSLLKS